MRGISRFFSVVFVAVGAATASYSTSCRCYPGDACWPSIGEWNSLNSSVNGRLIQTIPLGSPCHDPNYSESVCEYLQSQWQYPSIQYVQDFFRDMKLLPTAL